MSSPFISIIIPVYNAESYVASCLDSLQEQDFTDWEAICVNDGSKDGSLAILQKYASEDSRIRIINQQNAGVSAARNCAIQKASGQFILMVDSDDTLRPGALTAMTGAVQSDDVDIVLGGITRYFPEKGYSIEWGNMCWIETIAEGEQDRTSAILYSHRGPFARLCRRQILKDNNIIYNSDYVVGEDHEFNINCLLHARKIMAITESVYTYYERPSSVMKRFEMGLYADEVYRSAVDMYFHFIPLPNSTKHKRGHLHAAILFHSVDMLLYVARLLGNHPARICRISFPLIPQFIRAACRSNLISIVKPLHRIGFFSRLIHIGKLAYRSIRER